MTELNKLRDEYINKLEALIESEINLYWKFEKPDYIELTAMYRLVDGNEYYTAVGAYATYNKGIVEETEFDLHGCTFSDLYDDTDERALYKLMYEYLDKFKNEINFINRYDTVYGYDNISK